jgi:hypothetical protein
MAKDKRDLTRRRALMVFNILMYGFLLVMFLVQLHMAVTRNW